MQVNKAQVAVVGIALCSAMPVAAQSTITMEAEAMSLSTYAVENGNRIKLPSGTATGSATRNFSGANGTYNMQVYVVPENDGQPTLQVYKGTTLLRTYTYPLSSASSASFTISNVALTSGEAIRLVGQGNAGAHARVDKVVLTSVSTTPTTTTPTPTTTTPTPTTTTPIIGDAVASLNPVTMEAEAMTLASYAVENGRQIRVTASSGTATKNFGGVSGRYDMHVYVLPETDGQSTLEVYKGSTRLRTYTYPRSSSPTSFTISGLNVTSGESIRLVGRPNGGAWARVDKIVFTPQTAAAPTTPSAPTTPTDSGPLPAPSTGTRAVPTFESLSLYWRPPSNPGSTGCTVQYRKQGESTWKDGLAMWYDTRDGECRGSLVYLTPGTQYEVRMGMPGQQPSVGLTARTWSESFPIARVVHLPNGTSSETLNITQGGSASGYVLYTFPPGGQSTIDVANARPHNITISARYVIVRGLTLRGAQQDAIRLLEGASDVVIEDNDISGWGRYRTTTADGQQVGYDFDSAVRSGRLTGLARMIIQRNRIHHPRYGANSWTYGHPGGPQGITLDESPGGNHVIRHNEIYSGEGKYFNDGIGGSFNFSSVGFPHADSDIYGNLISHCWDDAIEAEGGNRNVRIFGNYMDRTNVGVATTATHVGPVYIFRNVHNRSRLYSAGSAESDSGGVFGKSGINGSYGNGRRYFFHNTTLQAAGSGATLGVGNGFNGPSGVTNTVSRNNVWHIKSSSRTSIGQATSTTNSLDYDLYNGGLSVYSGAEANGLRGTPIYQAGHGWASESNGLYQLAPNSPGYDRAQRLSNFNDHFTGAAPDMGAAEAGRPAMRFGIRAAAPASTSSDGAATR